MNRWIGQLEIAGLQTQDDVTGTGRQAQAVGACLRDYEKSMAKNDDLSPIIDRQKPWQINWEPQDIDIIMGSIA